MVVKAATTSCSNEELQSWFGTLSMFANIAIPFRPQLGDHSSANCSAVLIWVRPPGVKIRLLRIHILRSEGGLGIGGGVSPQLVFILVTPLFFNAQLSVACSKNEKKKTQAQIRFGENLLEKTLG